MTNMYIGDFHSPFGRARISIAIYAIVVIATCCAFGYALLAQGHNRLVLSGITQLKAQDSDRALLDLNDAVANLPFDGHAYFCRALAYENKGNHVRALRDLDTALRYGESKNRVLIAKACVEATASNYAKAADYCTLSALAQPNNVQSYAVRAAIHARCHQYELTTADCDNGLKVCESTKLRARLLRQRGIAQIKVGQGSAGIADLNGSLSMEPDAGAFLARANFHRTHNDLLAAISDYSKAIKMQPESANACVWRGVCYVGLHEDDAALSDFTHALSINPYSERALIQRGSLYERRSLWQLAANDFQDATKLDPFIKEAQDRYTIACAHLRSAPSAQPHRQAIASRDGARPQ
ncbi:MAG TPA: tetratricopeptide repeat protein [Candidatus Obscuribacterales bacterium]